MFELIVDGSYANHFRALLVECAEAEDLERAEEETARVLATMADDFKNQLESAGFVYFRDDPAAVSDIISGLQNLVDDMFDYLDEDVLNDHFEFFEQIRPMASRLAWEATDKLTGIESEQDFQRLKRDRLNGWI